jgi:hypothetical protein
MGKSKIISLKIKEECPKPVYLRGNSSFSILIAISQFVGLNLPSSGPTSILSVLRNQYPKCVSIIERSTLQASVGHKTVNEYIEISFDKEESLKDALSTPFCIQGQDIEVDIATDLTGCGLYYIEIDNIHLLDNPLDESNVYNYLQESGTVESLHFHYTCDGNWFTGKACAIWKGSPIIDNRRLTKSSYEI